MSTKNLIAAIDIGSNTLKITEFIISKTGVILNKVGIKEYQFKDKGIISKEIKSLWFKENFKAKRIISIIPRYQVLSRIIELQTTDKHKIEKILQLGIERYIPFPKEDIIYSWQILDIQNNKAKILLITVKKAVIEAHLQIIENAGFLPYLERIDISSLAEVGWYIHSNILTKNEVAIIIHIDATTLDVSIISANKPVVMRAFLIEKDNISKLLNELQLIIDFYKVTKIILSGLGEQIDEIVNFIEERTNLPITRIQEIPRDSRIFEYYPKIQNIILLLIPSIGTVLNHLQEKNPKINLLPSELLHKRQKKKSKVNLLSIGILSLSFILAIIFGISEISAQKELKLKKIESQFNTIKPQVIKIQRIREKIELMKSLINKQPLWLDILRELSKNTPSGIMVRELICGESNDEEGNNKEEISILGISNSNYNLTDFISQLNKLPYFGKVKLQYTNKEVNNSIIEFKITCQVKR